MFQNCPVWPPGLEYDHCSLCLSYLLPRTKPTKHILEPTTVLLEARHSTNSTMKAVIYKGITENKPEDRELSSA